MNRAIASTMIGACIAFATIAPSRPALAQAPVMPQPPAQPGPPVPPAPAPQPATDPRVAQIKAALERNGLQVQNIFVTKGHGPDFFWWVYTPAEYARPTRATIRNQAVKVWYWMSTVLGQEPPGTTMASSQVWTKYFIQLLVEVGPFNAFLASYRAAKDDNERATLFHALGDKIGLRIFDAEKEQWVDVRDFINKNFAR